MPDLDLAAPEFLADPYPHYAALRRIDPVFYSRDRGIWLITGYDVCQRLLRDRRLGHYSPPGSPMLFQNPPDHTRLRQLAAHAFTRRRIEGLEERVRGLADTLIDGFEERGEADLVGDFAHPLPVMVISELMGIPLEDRSRIADWSLPLAKMLDPDRGSEADVGVAQAGISLQAYLTHLFEERRRRPGDDLISALLQTESEGDRLSIGELFTTCILLVAAGHVTTVNLIANGMLALLRHPEQRALLVENDGRIENAVEELLRFDSPVQVTHRNPLESFEFDGRRFTERDTLGFFLGAANRDPARFERPDELDVTRPDNSHLAFGGGIHFCLGAPLARLEARAAVSALLRRLPELALAIEEPEYPDSYVIRGPLALPVTFREG